MSCGVHGQVPISTFKNCVCCRDLQFAAMTGDIKGMNLTQATQEQVAQIQHMLTSGTLSGLPVDQKGLVHQQMLDLLGVGQQQPMKALAGCI